MSPSSHYPLENKHLNKNPLFLIKTGKPLTVRKSHTWTKFTISLSRKFSYLVSMASCCLVYKSQKIKKRERKEMKKKLLAGMLASATVLGMFVAGGTALAADTNDTEVGIGFSLHHPGTNPGDLQILWTPLELDFGSTNTVNTAVQDFDEQDEAGGVKKYAVVEDTRPHGSSDPDVEWKLTAKVAELVSTSNPATKLDGAVLKFDTDMHGYQGTISPEISGIVATSGQTATMAANYSLTTGALTATEVMKDGSTSGPTSFEGNTAMEMKNIKLTVPANVAKKGHHYTGDLTWSLDDTI